MKGMEATVAELTARLNRVQRELSRMNARNAKPTPVPNGWWLCVLQGSLVSQGTATAKVIVWNSEDEAWEYADPERTIEIRDFWMNDGESIDADTRIKAVWYRNVWTWDQAYCSEADNLPEEPEE